MAEPDIRTYRRDEAVCFRKTDEPFGGLSNMAPGFPIFIFGRRIRTSEALYQACRFPHLPEVQALILDESSPMTAKMRSKPFRARSRPDWDRVRVPIMKWCLRTKLLHNWERFSELLLSTGEKPIVEDSRKDAFWGAISEKDNAHLVGENILGRLLMELRSKLLNDQGSLQRAEPPNIECFLLVDHPIPVLSPYDCLSADSDDLPTPATQLAFL